jgi:ribosomal protein S18 acetylase RimI-like enzyme
MIRQHDYFKIVAGALPVGGAIVFRRGARAYELARLFIDPEFQNEGIGTEVLELLWQQYPLAKKWMLDTPAWNERTLHFYEKAGFVETRRDRRGLVYFARG